MQLLKKKFKPIFAARKKMKFSLAASSFKFLTLPTLSWTWAMTRRSWTSFSAGVSASAKLAQHSRPNSAADSRWRVRAGGRQKSADERPSAAFMPADTS